MLPRRPRRNVERVVTNKRGRNRDPLAPLMTLVILIMVAAILIVVIAAAG